jgi:protein-disulfide isomerase
MDEIASSPKPHGIGKSQEKASPAINRGNLILAMIPLAFVLGILAGYLYWGRGPGTAPAIALAVKATADAQAQNADQNQQIKRYDVPIDDDPILGPNDAPITIIEFSDYECPYCRKWHTETFARLMQAYPGKIRFVYRDFPLTSIHPDAQSAAEAADCAGEQGKYYEFSEKLFTGQALNAQVYNQYASDLGLDTKAFGTCFSSGRYTAEVTADLNWAADLGVRSTPTFFINGLPVVGAQPYEVFQQVIDKELAGEIPK